METSIEYQLELTKVNKIIEKISQGYSLEETCKSLGVSTGELIRYINKPEIITILGENHKALKGLIFNKLSILVEGSLDKLEYLQKELIEESEDPSVTIQKITALNSLVNTYLKSLSLLGDSLSVPTEVSNGITEDTVKFIFDKIVGF